MLPPLSTLLEESGGPLVSYGWDALPAPPMTPPSRMAYESHSENIYVFNLVNVFTIHITVYQICYDFNMDSFILVTVSR